MLSKFKADWSDFLSNEKKEKQYPFNNWRRKNKIASKSIWLKWISWIVEFWHLKSKIVYDKGEAKATLQRNGFSLMKTVKSYKWDKVREEIWPNLSELKKKCWGDVGVALKQTSLRKNYQIPKRETKKLTYFDHLLRFVQHYWKERVKNESKLIFADLKLVLMVFRG
jgi:hypothetical protein